MKHSLAPRRGDTDAELRLWHLLRNRNLKGFKFRRQHPIGTYIADFVCLEQQLVIELDGSQHAERTQYDSRRTEVLEAAGFRVIRFWDNDVLTHMESVMQSIYSALSVSPHPSPLPTDVGRGSTKRSPADIAQGGSEERPDTEDERQRPWILRTQI
ncbi:MAG TPA: endonuclease domain-containing protein [Burkholderiales bacterium]|nr:endonuclease domain-containing protein [Burkholderiales bacterium]